MVRACKDGDSLGIGTARQTAEAIGKAREAVTSIASGHWQAVEPCLGECFLALRRLVQGECEDGGL